jgi:hypothetical protein
VDEGICQFSAGGRKHQKYSRATFHAVDSGGGNLGKQLVQNQFFTWPDVKMALIILLLFRPRSSKGYVLGTDFLSGQRVLGSQKFPE